MLILLPSQFQQGLLVHQEKATVFNAGWKCQNDSDVQQHGCSSLWEEKYVYSNTVHICRLGLF